jgi:hypothetical protein
MLLSNIHQIAAGSFANLPRFRVLGNPTPLARASMGMERAGAIPSVENCRIFRH